MSYVIGLDCGGTHIVGQLWNKDSDTLLAEVTSGPGNVVMNYSGATHNIIETIKQLLDNTQSPVDQILVGISGVESLGKTEKISSLLTKACKLPVNVISDAKLALLNGLQGKSGSLVISGTGSIIYGYQNGNFIRVGGLGYILGDEGSAYDIGMNALRLVLTNIDAGKKSSLQEPLFKFLKVKNNSEAIAKFYSSERKDNANMALVVAKEAEKNNQDAINILDNCADKLANQTITLIKRFTEPIPNKVSLSGSVLHNNQLFNKLIRQKILKTFPNIEFSNIESNNAHGVIYFDKWKNNFK